MLHIVSENGQSPQKQKKKLIFFLCVFQGDD